MHVETDDAQHVSSVTDAVRRYVRLRQLLASPRSIPLGLGKVMLARTETAKGWDRLRAEFADLASCMPPNESLQWHILVMDVMSDAMPDRKRKALEALAGRRMHQWLIDKEADSAYLTTARKLRSRGLLPESSSKA